MSVLIIPCYIKSKWYIDNLNRLLQGVSLLIKTLNHYNIKIHEFEKHCTLKIYGEKLNILGGKYKIDLNLHEALLGAMACAKLFYLDHTKKKLK
jgi:hypothetical protein